MTADATERIGAEMSMPLHMVEIVSTRFAMQDAHKSRAPFWLGPEWSLSSMVVNDQTHVPTG